MTTSMHVLGQFVSAMTNGSDHATPTPQRARSGRPVTPSSLRQRILAWLDEHDHGATSSEIANGLGVQCNNSLFSALNDLANEEKIARGPKVSIGKSMRNTWRTA